MNRPIISQKAQNWIDAGHHRARADESGTQIRAILIAIATLLIGQILEYRKETNTVFIFASSAFLIYAWWLLYRSWIIQKSKNLNYKKIIENNGLDSYSKRKPDPKKECEFKLKMPCQHAASNALQEDVIYVNNYRIDNAAANSILIAAAIFLFSIFFSPCDSKLYNFVEHLTADWLKGFVSTQNLENGAENGE